MSRVVLLWYDACWCYGVVRLGWCGTRMQAEAVLQPGVVSWLQPGHYSSLTSPNLQPTANQERNDQGGNQHHSRKLLTMGIVMPETCFEPIRSTIK